MSFVITSQEHPLPIVVTCKGELDASLVLGVLQAIKKQRGVGPVPPVLWDLRNVTSASITHDQVEEIMEALQGPYALGPGRSAWLTLPEKKDVGMVGMLLVGRLNDGRERRGFTDYDEALRWLARDPAAGGGEGIATGSG